MLEEAARSWQAEQVEVILSVETQQIKQTILPGTFQRQIIHSKLYTEPESNQVL